MNKLASLLLFGLVQLSSTPQAPELPSVTSRTLRTEPAKTEDERVLMMERVASADGFLLITRTLLSNPPTVAYATQAYDRDGVPIESRQEGSWNDRWNILATKYGADACEQSINGVVTTGRTPAREFANPTTLWFWKTHPEPGTSATVSVLSQNNLSISKITFTYEGDEELEVAGRKVTAHRVRETPLSSAAGVYTLWWYDDEGMGIRRYHKTTTGEFRCDLLCWR